MPEADGQVRIKVSLDTDGVDKDMKKLQSTLSRQSESLQRQGIAVEKLTEKYDALYQKAQKTATPNFKSDQILKDIQTVEQSLKELSNDYSNAKLTPNVDNSARIQRIISDHNKLSSKLTELKKQYQEIQFSPEVQGKLNFLRKEIDLAIQKEKRLTDEVNNTKSAINDLQSRRISGFQDNFDKVSRSLGDMKNTVKGSQDAARNLASGFDDAGEKMGGVFDGICKKVEGFGKRILRLASSAFIFNIISSGFREMEKGIQNIISSDNQLSNSLAQVQANLWTAFYPIYQAILPALRVLGQALSWITAQIANFIASLTGTSVKANQSGAKVMAVQAQGENKKSKALNKQAKGYDNIGKAAKRAKGELASFDKIEVLRQKNADKGLNSKSPESGGAGALPNIMKGFNQSIKGFNSPLLNMIIDRFKELAGIFKKGFNMGLVDRNFNDVINNFKRIGTVIQRIFNDPNVANGFNKALYSIVQTLGIITGMMASVGVTIGRLLVGGISKSLEESEGRIKNSIVKFFDITSELSDFAGKFAIAFANIFEVFGGEEAKSLLGNALSGDYALFESFFMNLYNLTSDLAVVIFKPFVTHQEGIKGLFRRTLDAMNTMAEGTKKVYQQIADTMTDVYQNSVSPAIKVLGEIWNDTFGIIIESWSTHISPALKQMAQKWDETVNKHVNPAIQSFGKFVNKYFGAMIPIIKGLWEFLKPFIKWVIENIFDGLSTSLKNLWGTTIEVFGGIMEILSGLFKELEGWVDLVVGLFSGDWERAWKGAGRVVEGMVDVVKGAINTLSGLISGVLNGMIGAINAAIRSLNRISFDIPEWLPMIGGKHFGLNIPEIPKGFGNIPRLEKGAVLEGGNPFLAWINDQPKGQTNIETPLSTMIEAFKSAMRGTGGQNIVIEANGDFNQFIRFLNFRLKQEDSRIGQSFITGDSWI